MSQPARSVSGDSAESSRTSTEAASGLKAAAAITRHNPHPHRCVHISALQGCQVPSVVDNGMPLDLHICYPTARPELLRAAAASPDVSLGGLAKPQHVEQFARLLAQEEKSKPESRGAGARAGSWREALSSLTRETFGVGAGMSGGSGGGGVRSSRDWTSQPRAGPTNPIQARESQRLYSPLTGRLIAANDAPSHAGGDPPSAAISKLELMQGSVMGMLCRILQTQDQAAVGAWLMAASPRERELATDIIRSSMANRDEYFVESLPAACSICRTPSRLSTRDSMKTAVTGNRRSTVQSRATNDAANSTKSASSTAAGSVRQANVVDLGFEDTAVETVGKPRRAAAPVAAAGKKTSLPSLLAGKSGAAGRKQLCK